MMLFGLFRRKSVVDAVDLSSQNLRDVPVGLYEQNRSLQRLYLGRNFLRDFPNGILRFDGLTELDLSDNDLLYLPPMIGHFQQLKALNLSGNNLPYIPDGIQSCEELISINFSSNPLGRICDGITQLRQLRHLKLNDCELDTLPTNIGNLSKLETLELRDNHLNDLPNSFSELQNLEKLDIGTNEYESLPSHIGQLPSLMELWLDNNILLGLPDEIGMLTNLVFFEASENRFIDLPSTFGDLQSMKDLYLNDNLLSQLPDSFGNLHNLQTCKLATNRLLGLPDTLTGLHMLHDLDISYNFVSMLPNSLCSLNNLQSLNVNNNSLEELPKEIGLCSSLTVLSLRNNKVAVMPKSVTQLQNLKVLTAVGNRLSKLPFGFLEIKTLKAIWLAENQINPILKFQTQDDPESGEKWITCVVFPQKEPKNTYEESQVSGSGSDLTMVEIYGASPSRHSVSVNFHSETKDNKNSISRDLTPFPKELRNRVNKWKKTRDIRETDPTGDDDTTTVTVELRHSTPRKLSRPYSLLHALNNPVQDSHGVINRDTVSPNFDLLMSLPLSEIVEKSSEASSKSDDTSNDQENNDAPMNSDTPPSTPNNDLENNEVQLSGNTNSNNNSQSCEPEVFPQHQNAPSIISDTSSILSTKLTKFMKDEGAGHDIPAWYLSPTPSPFHRHAPESSTSVMEKMLDMEDDQYMNGNISSPPSHTLTSPPAFISPIYDDVHRPRIVSLDLTSPMNSNRDSVLSSQNSRSTDLLQRSTSYASHYQSPASMSRIMDESHYDYVKPRRSSLENRLREKDLAIEYTLQAQLKPEVVYNSDYCRHPAAAEHIYSHPRSYIGSSNSGRNTPETPRAAYKSMSSLCDSGIESSRRPTPIGASYLSRSASTGICLDSSCSPRTYEVTLRKNPTLGMAITGGKDGENVIYPNDKGFHVYRLVDGMPASSCGKISIGDRILEVNGVNVDNLTNAQIVRLLTSPEAYTTVLFCRIASMTLL